MTRRAFVAALVPLAGLQIPRDSGTSISVDMAPPAPPQKFYLHGPLLRDHNGCTTPALVVYGTDKLDAVQAAGLQIDDVQEYYQGGEAAQAACRRRTR